MPETSNKPPEPAGVTPPSALRNIRRPVSKCIAFVMTAAIFFFAASSYSQDTRSQRRLSHGPEPLKPLDQLRLMLQIQRTTEMLTHRMNNSQNRKFNRETIRKLTEEFGNLYSPTSPAQSRLTHPEPTGSLQLPEALRSRSEDPDHSEQSRTLHKTPRSAIHEATPVVPGSDVALHGQQGTEYIQRSQSVTVPPPVRETHQSPYNRAGQSKQYEQFLNEPRKNRTGENIVQHSTDRRQENQIAASNLSTSNNEISPFDIDRELENGGLKKTLKRLFRDVREEVQQKSQAEIATSKETAANSVWNQALSSILNTVKTDIVRVVRDLKKHKPDRSKQDRTLTNTTHRTHVRSALTNSNDELTSAKTFTPPANPRKNPVLTTSGNSPVRSWSLRDSDLTQLLAILFCLMIAAFIIFGAARNTTRAVHRKRAHTLAAIRPDNIRTRADVIHAFHQLTHCQSPDSAEWWNHLQAAASLSQTIPKRQQSLQQLTYLYEEARYKRDTHTFDQTLIQQARTALAGCLS
ncbi:MAG: hypothetical protein MK102_16075 [Fuerstiella sp.]|nr:hypothetical protein [Fuerstiella sp.]